MVHIILGMGGLGLITEFSRIPDLRIVRSLGGLWAACADKITTGAAAWVACAACRGGLDGLGTAQATQAAQVLCDWGISKTLNFA